MPALVRTKGFSEMRVVGCRLMMTGHVISHPVLKADQRGVEGTVGGFRLMTDKEDQDPMEALPIWCRFTGKVAEQMSLYVKQGKRIQVQGQLKAKRVELPMKEGVLLCCHYIQVERFRMVRPFLYRNRLNNLTKKQKAFLQTFGMNPFDVPASALKELGIEVPDDE